MQRLNSAIIFILLLTIGVQCTIPSGESGNGKLPIFGFKDVDSKGDTIYHKIPDFSFIDQDSNIITNETFAGKAYITDFFFIHCPSICPKVKAQMMRIYDEFENNDQLLMISHSIDTRNDTVPALKAYANKLDVNTEKWRFVTGEHDLIYEMADDYFITALVDEDAPGGFDHSGTLILVDKNRHVRASANGTDPKSVDEFLVKIEKLLNEE